MHMICSGMATLAVAAIYCTWRCYVEVVQRREGVLRRRVAYMLWVIATQAE
jgi:hypothetical protein